MAFHMSIENGLRSHSKIRPKYRLRNHNSNKNKFVNQDIINYANCQHITQPEEYNILYKDQ